MPAANPDATVFGYFVQNPEAYGVAELDSDGRVRRAWKKNPSSRRSNYAVTGLYLYDRGGRTRPRSLRAQPRGELEITDLNRLYLERGQLLSRKDGARGGLARHRHARFVAAGGAVHPDHPGAPGTDGVLPRGNRLRKGWIDGDRLKELAEPLAKTGYGQYLLQLRNGPAMKITQLEIPEILLVEPKVFGDTRGYFHRNLPGTLRGSRHRERFVQDNLSRSSRGILRGLHLQYPAVRANWSAFSRARSSTWR